MYEQPFFVLPQVKSRAVVVKAISLTILGIIFYIGILVNLSFLDLSGKEETIIKTTSLIILSIVVIVGVILSYKHASQPYKFFHSHVQVGKEVVFYVEIANTEPKRDILDKIFKTYKISLRNHLFLRNIPNNVDMSSYLKQLISYSHNQQPPSTT